MNCVICPDAANTVTVDNSEITIMATRNSFITPHDSMSFTLGGMNISGIMYIKNLPVSFTADNFMSPVDSAANIITIP